MNFNAPNYKEHRKEYQPIAFFQKKYFFFFINENYTLSIDFYVK